MGDMQEMRIAFPSPQKLLTPGVIILLSLLVAGFLGLALGGEAVGRALALSPRAVLHGKIWQLVTYPFLNDTFGLLGNGMVILFFGSAIEREWRTASFLLLWLTVTVACGLLWILLNLLLGFSMAGLGAGVGSFGLIATFGLLFRGQRFFAFFGTIEAQHMALGLIAIGVILSLPVPITLVWVAGALVAYVYVKARWSLQAKPSVRPGLQRSGGKGQFVDID
jgi:membrane associated rhomboid family serine protease